MARKRIKASMKKQRNTAPGFKALDPNYFNVRNLLVSKRRTELLVKNYRVAMIF